MKKPVSVFLCALLIAGLAVSAPSAFAAPEIGEYDLFVSPEGDDAAAGTLDEPLKTVRAAKEKLKALKDVPAQDETVHVWLRAGRYEFDDTLRFTADDLPNVAYAAYNGEEAVISGAKEITGFHEETVNGVRTFTKTLTAQDPSGFKSLFKGNAQLTVPRYPETGYFTVNGLCPEDDLWTPDDTPWEFTLGQRSFCADPADLTPFTNPTDVQVRILHYWHDELMYLTGIDYETGKLGLSRPSSMKIQTIDRYYFENVFEAMNEPGEWYLNTRTNVLYYVPEADETAETCVLRASSLECLLDVNGVSGISFKGIRFTETDWNVPTPGEWEGGWRGENDIDALQAALDVKGVVTVQYAENVRFTNCEFTNLGADGVKFMNGVKHSRVENCLFTDIAATGVFVGGANCLPDEPDCTADITVKNNLVSGYGRKFYCAIGVHITYCDGAEISHNEINDGYYTAISCGWNWGYTYHLTNRIRITDNLIYNIGQGWLSDMGGIYMLGVQPGTVLSGNVIHNIAADSGEGGYGGWGVYLDEGSSRMLVEKNLVFCCGSQSYNIHYGEGNVFRNNIGALSAEGQVSAGSRGNETHATAFYYDNIFVTDGTPVYVYMCHTGHFYENGNLFWDVSRGANVRFSENGGSSELSLSKAKSGGYIHNETVADPLFADIGNYDFTLAEDSPAFALNFKAWDYQNAGTLKGTTVGLHVPGGETAYNDCAAPALPTGQKRSSAASLSSYLLPVAEAIALLLAALWLVMSLLHAPKNALLMLACTALAALAGWFVYRTFVNWSPVLYVLGLLALCAALAAMPAIGEEKREKVILRFVVRFVCIFAAFFAAVLLLNNLLRIGEANVMAVTLTCLGIYAAVCSLLTLRRSRANGNPQPRNEG